MSKKDSCFVLRSDIEPFTTPLKKEIKQLQAELAKHRWIPIEERLPNAQEHTTRSKVMWLVTGPSSVIQASYCHYNKCWYADSSGVRVSGTHWKPIILPDGE